MFPSQKRNTYFANLFANERLLWLGQNTNHLPTHPAVKQAMTDCIEKETYHAYAPPMGFPELHELILADLGLANSDAAVLVTDGAIEALYHGTTSLCGPGDRFITTDPGWLWTNRFAELRGAEIVSLPIYESTQKYKLTSAQLSEACDRGARIIYLIDPLNPLGTSYSAPEVTAFAELARDAGAILIHDATYRAFADRHTLAHRFYPEGTITTYSFSKWLGLAGLRIGACVAHPDLIKMLATAQPNNLGSSVLAQRAAIAGLRIKPEWFPEVQRIQRENQKTIKAAAEKVAGLTTPIYPSQGNFLAVDCRDAGIKPDALVAAYHQHNIMIRQAGYHTSRYADHFVKISTTVPEDWVARLCEILPDAVEQARAESPGGALY
jgi:aspartate/methionine/tyrosine aminotransferase